MRTKIINFIHDFYKKNNTTPRLKDFKKKDGFPCNKETLLKIFGTYNALIEECGYETYSYGQRHYNKKELLDELKDVLLQHRTIDFNYLRKDNYLKHRNVYTKVFGSARLAFKELGLTNNQIFLLKSYSNYNFEDPKVFLEKELKIVYNQEMLKMLNTLKEIDKQGKPILRDLIGQHLSVNHIYKFFGSFNSFLILGGVEVNLSNKNFCMAIDGHLCDSYEEKIIDDILNELNIRHKLHTKYPGSKLVCDFELGDAYIECVGYSRNATSKKHSVYINKLDEKYEIARSHCKKFITISRITHFAKKDLMEALASDCHRITL